MSTVITDFGSANSHKNNWEYLKKMIDSLKEIDTGKHTVIIKHQLFNKDGDNIPLSREIFKQAYLYAKGLGYQSTSSVFDKESLAFLLHFDIPFVKLANRRDLDYLTAMVPRGIPVYKSVADYRTFIDCFREPYTNLLCCVSKYPAVMGDYEKAFSHWHLQVGISDHTTDFELWEKYQPAVIEMHYVLEHDDNNLDGGLFAKTPAQLAEIL